jgi:mono/diheme cytochrome c family protein
VLVGLTVGALADVVLAQARTITLPADSDYATLAAGTHRELAQTQCQLCHSTDYIVMQPRGDAKQWDAVVTKMIKVFGAPLGEADARAIVEYLATAYGPAR